MTKSKIRKIFIKLLMVAAVAAAQSIYTRIHAQQYLVRSDNHRQFGKLFRYAGPYFEIQSEYSVIKTYANSCIYADHTAGRGFYCTFGEFQIGRPLRSGWIYILDQGLVLISPAEEVVFAFHGTPPERKWIRLETVIMG